MPGGGSRAPQELTTGLQRCGAVAQQRPPPAATAAGQPPAPAAAASEAALQQLARQARDARHGHRTLDAVQARLQVRLAACFADLGNLLPSENKGANADGSGEDRKNWYPQTFIMCRTHSTMRDIR